MSSKDWVDFAEVKKAVSILAVLEDWKVEGLRHKGDKLVGPCPVHGGNNPNAFHVDLGKNVWHCFTKCSGGGNVLDLVARHDRCTVREAALYLHRRFLAGSPAAELPPVPAVAPATASTPAIPAAAAGPAPATAGAPTPAKRSTPTKVNPPLSFHLNLMADHPYLTDVRRLAPATIQHFGLGYCGKGIMKGRIAIPIHDAEGKLVAYAGRRLKDPADAAEEARNPKYRFPAEFQKHLVLYNLHRARTANLEQVVVVEGFFSVFTLFEAGYPNVVALMGSSMSEAQREQLLVFPHIVLLFDGDSAGQACTDAVLAQLKGKVALRVVRLKEGKQPDKIGRDVLARVLA